MISAVLFTWTPEPVLLALLAFLLVLSTYIVVMFQPDSVTSYINHGYSQTQNEQRDAFYLDS